MSSFPTIRFDGEDRALACLPRDPASGLRRYRDWNGPLDPALLVPGAIEVPLVQRDQRQTSACGGFSMGYATTCLHGLRDPEVVELSSTYLYAKVNGGVDQGSNLGDLLNAFLAWGNCPREAWPDQLLVAGQATPAQTAQADAQARVYQGAEGYEVHTAGEVLAGVSRRQPVVIGIYLGDNFAQVDSEGISPAPRNLRGGHALLARELYVSPRKGLCVGGPNSWGPNFGIAGNYRIAVADYLGQLVDAVCLLRQVPNPQDGPLYS